MKYMLMMNTPRDGYTQDTEVAEEDPRGNVAFMHDFNKKLKAAGELVGAEGLASPTQAKLVRAGADGTPITDGVFPETKEFLAGYWIVDVESPERAYEIAARGVGGAGARRPPMNMPIEVRQVMSGPPEVT